MNSKCNSLSPGWSVGYGFPISWAIVSSEQAFFLLCFSPGNLISMILTP